MIAGMHVTKTASNAHPKDMPLAVSETALHIALLQVLREKLYDKWQEDPAVFGVDLTHFGQQRLTCPQCQNGSKSEDGFAVSVQEDSVLWKCHRATCDFHGGVTLMGGTNADSAKVMQVAREQYSSVMKAPGTTQEFAARAEDAFRQLQKQVGWHVLEAVLVH